MQSKVSDAFRLLTNQVRCGWFVISLCGWWSDYEEFTQKVGHWEWIGSVDVCLTGTEGIRGVMVLSVEGLALCLPPPLTLHVCMAAHSNEVTKNVRNSMLTLKWEGLGWETSPSLSEAAHLLINMCWAWPKSAGQRHTDLRAALAYHTWFNRE